MILDFEVSFMFPFRNSNESGTGMIAGGPADEILLLRIQPEKTRKPAIRQTDKIFTFFMGWFIYFIDYNSVIGL
jgi:hypothetical protein